MPKEYAAGVFKTVDGVMRRITTSWHPTAEDAEEMACHERQTHKRHTWSETDGGYIEFKPTVSQENSQG